MSRLATADVCAPPPPRPELACPPERPRLPEPGCPPKPLSLRGLLPETLDVGDLLLALILLLLYLDSEDEDPKSLLIILAVCFFL